MSELMHYATRCLKSVELTCAACDSTLQEPISLLCGHSYCRVPCIGTVMTGNQSRCMQCNEPVSVPLHKLRVSYALHATITVLKGMVSMSNQNRSIEALTPPPMILSVGTEQTTENHLSMQQSNQSNLIPATPLSSTGTPPVSLGSALPNNKWLSKGNASKNSSLGIPLSSSSQDVAGKGALAAEWTCSVCTSTNRGDKCEACTMPAPDDWILAKGGLNTLSITDTSPNEARELTPWERGEYNSFAARRGASPVEEDVWHTSGTSKTTGSSSSLISSGAAASVLQNGVNGSLPPARPLSSSTSSGTSSRGVESQEISRPSVTGAGPGTVSKLIPLVGEGFPPNAVQKTSGAGSSFTGKGKGGGPGSGLLVRFHNGVQCRGMVLTVMTGVNVKKGSHVHGFIGITRSKNRELFDHILESCPEGVREFRNGYAPNTRHATLTFQFPDLVLTEEEKKHDEFGPQAAKIMDDLLCKEVYFEVLWSPRWGRFVAHNVYLVA